MATRYYGFWLVYFHFLVHMIIIFNLKKILKLILCLHTIKKNQVWNLIYLSQMKHYIIKEKFETEHVNIRLHDFFFSLSLLWCLFTTRTTSTKIQILLIIYFFFTGRQWWSFNGSTTRQSMGFGGNCISRDQMRLSRHAWCLHENDLL